MIVLENDHAVRSCDIISGILVQCYSSEDGTCFWSTGILVHYVYHPLAWLDFTKHAKHSLSTDMYVILTRSDFLRHTSSPHDHSSGDWVPLDILCINNTVLDHFLPTLMNVTRRYMM